MMIIEGGIAVVGEDDEQFHKTGTSLALFECSSKLP